MISNRLKSLNDRTVNRQTGSLFFYERHTLLVFRVRREHCPADLVFSHRAHVDHGKGFTGLAGKICRRVIAHHFAAALYDGRELRLSGAGTFIRHAA